jgi:predicted dehydrogenase
MAAEGIWMRYLPIVENLKTLCTNSIIGDIKMLSGEIGYHLTQERLFDPEMAGGALLDIGVYAVALAGIVFGYDVADISSHAMLTERGVDETNSFIIKYRSGKMASLSTSMTFMSTCRGTIWGSNGYADIDNINRLNNICVYDKNRREIARYTNPNVENSYVFELRSLFKALQEGRLDTPEVPHEEILQRMKLMDDIRKQWNMTYPFEN